MLFRKDIDPRCSYCAKGCRISENEILCKKKGIVSPEYHCHAFRYDPLLRERLICCARTCIDSLQ